MIDNQKLFHKLPSNSLIRSKVQQSKSHLNQKIQGNLAPLKKLDDFQESKPNIWSGSLFVRTKAKANSSRKVYNFQGGGFKGMIIRAKRVQKLLPGIESTSLKPRNKIQSQSDVQLKQVFLPCLYRSISYSSIPNQIKN
jgi:hypothetical protein